MTGSEFAQFDPAVEDALRARVGHYILGAPLGRGVRVGIACARFNGAITVRLLNSALDALFEAAQQRPPWAQRQAAMLQQIEDLIGYCESAGMDHSATDWRDRRHRTQTWTGE